MNTHFFSLFTLHFKVLWTKWCKIRNFIVELFAVKVMFPIAGRFQRKSPGQLEIPELLKLPEGSFGKELGLHMQKNKIEFLPGFEEHDMKHLLMEYPLSIEGEILLSAFEFGSGNHSMMTMGVFLPAWIIAPEMWKHLIDQYKKGKNNTHTRKIHLKSELQFPLDEVRKKLNIR